MPGLFLALASKRGRWNVVIQARPCVGRGARYVADGPTHPRPTSPRLPGPLAESRSDIPFSGARGPRKKSKAGGHRARRPFNSREINCGNPILDRTCLRNELI